VLLSWPAKHYEDWELEDLSDTTTEEVRPIRDEICRRVEQLLLRLEVPPLSIA